MIALARAEPIEPPAPVNKTQRSVKGMFIGSQPSQGAAAKKEISKASGDFDITVPQKLSKVPRPPSLSIVDR
jgi:hypothetical protein